MLTALRRRLTLLMTALTQTKNPQVIQQYFHTY